MHASVRTAADISYVFTSTAASGAGCSCGGCEHPSIYTSCGGGGSGYAGGPGAAKEETTQGPGAANLSWSCKYNFLVP